MSGLARPCKARLKVRRLIALTNIDANGALGPAARAAVLLVVSDFAAHSQTQADQHAYVTLLRDIGCAPAILYYFRIVRRQFELAVFENPILID
jgi:hypothetical protein